MESVNSLRVIKIAAAQYPIDFFQDLNDWQKKTAMWVQEAADSGAEYLVFPEYGAMELTSLLNENERKDLSLQAKFLIKFIDVFKQTFLDLAKKHQVCIIAPSFPFYQTEDLTTNRVFVFSPSGKMDYQDKIFMTRFEDEEWNVQAGEYQIKVFHTEKLNFSISTCFDVEFALPSLVAAHAGAEVIFAPSCTETVKGAARVHIGARARALENQCYVVVSQTIGEAAWSQAVDMNYGYAAVYSTPDVGFPDDGKIKEGLHNHAQWVIQDLNLSKIQKVRTHGAVLNFKRHQNIFSQETELSLKSNFIDLR